MKCQQRPFDSEELRAVPCEKQAVVKVWCPTWFNAKDGVFHLCNHHAEAFMKSKDGTFYFGVNAEAKYREAYPNVR